MKKALAGTIAGLLLAACGTGDGSGDRATTTTIAATTAAVETTTSQTPSSTTVVEGLEGSLPGALEIAVTEDLIFHQGDERFDPSSGYMDVIAPVSEGSWPTVVVFHGEGATKQWHRPDATMLAEQGRVVFLPNWSWTDVAWRAANGTRADFELIFREAACALVYARARAAEFGGDPDHITVYGYSAGGNAALMAGLASLTPVEMCAEPGEVATPQAVVAIDADWLVAPPQWDGDLIADPELFYVVTPYRALDASHGIPVHTMSTEGAASIWERRVPADPAQSWFEYRHIDVDLAAELEELGFLDDGYVDVQEFARYGHHVLAQLGYETTFTVLPDSNHAHWSDEARAVVVERVLYAEEGTAAVVETVLRASGAKATGTISVSVQDWEGMEGYRLLATAWSEQDEVMAGLSGAAFWTRVDTDPFSSQDVIHPPAIPPGDDLPWAVGDYLWNETAQLQPGTYRVEFYANPGELAPYGNYVPANPIERSCWIDVEVRAGETSTVVISDLPLGNGPCPEISP